MKMKALAVLAALCMPTAHSEELTKPELGRLDVSKCYITCSDQILRMVPAFYNTALLSEPNFEQVWCIGVQMMMNTADTCQAGCRDLEAVYGPIDSWAKTRYRRAFEDIKAGLVESGLWTNYANYPHPNNSPWAFQQACSRYSGN